MYEMVAIVVISLRMQSVTCPKKISLPMRNGMKNERRIFALYHVNADPFHSHMDEQYSAPPVVYVVDVASISSDSPSPPSLSASRKSRFGNSTIALMIIL